MIGLGADIWRGVPGAGGLAYSPLAMFALGQQGAWYDPSDLSTLFQDAAGTIPVTGTGQPVGLMLDKRLGLVRGAELASGLTPFSDASGTTTHTESAITTTGSQGGVTLPLTVGNWYALSATGGTSATELSINTANLAINPTARTVIRTTIGDCVFLADKPFLYLRQTGGGTGTVNSLSLKELPGNHATQATAASRPIFRRGDSRGVVNLLTWSEAFDNAAWGKSGGMTVTPNAVAAPGGSLTADKLVEGTTPSVSPLALQAGTFPPDSQITASCRVKAAGRGFVRVQIAATNGNTYAATRFNLTTGAKVVTDSDVALNGATNVSSSIVAEGEDYYLCSLSCKVPPGIVSARLELRLVPDATTFSYTGDGASGVYVHGAQLNLGSTALPYQRNDATFGGVATGASSDLHWLECDGVDDGMVTGSIDFTGTNKMLVCAGVRKLSDAASGMIAELSANIGVNNSCFNLGTTFAAGANFSLSSKGAIRQDAVTPNSFPSPYSAVLSGTMDIANDLCLLLLNGAAAATNSADQGTGNFGNYPLYLFRRGGSSLPFNGLFYGAIIAGAAYSASQIASAERYLAGKSGVTV